MQDRQDVMAECTNGRSIPLDLIPEVNETLFREAILSGVSDGMRVCALFGEGGANSEAVLLYAVLADDEENSLHVCRTGIVGDHFTSMTPECPQVHLFEREIAEQFGLIPIGHPWLKPVRWHHAWVDRDAWGRKKSAPIAPSVGTFFQVAGEQVHEVAVGPVHAGIIEPGHFRFQCQGEEVLHLEISLGYQHRGIEQMLAGGPFSHTMPVIETIAGDSTVGHALCYCQAMEDLSDTRKSARGNSLRGIALELERIANHVGDLGALAGEIGFQPTAGFCGRIRGDWLNLTALLCGNRFGRGFVVPGGVAWDMEPERIETMRDRMKVLEKDTQEAISLLWDNHAVLSRFEETGVVSRENAEALGLVGPAARACGLMRDARFNLPSGPYRFSGIPVSTCSAGDVFSRAYVRWLEIQQSIRFIRSQMEAMPPGPIRHPAGEPAPGRLVAALNEGWRGEICHVAITDQNGKFSRYKIVDPSFHNWPGLAISMRNQAISDFPVCNKSFNLSYCGHDL